MISADDLRLPIRDGARVVAASYLNGAIESSRRLSIGSIDPEALHDFRVAARRLDSWIRAFRDELAGVRKRDRRRLRDIARATNGARDAEVQIAWLRDASGGGGRGSRRRKAGAAWMIAILDERERRSSEELTEEVGERFGKVQAALREALDANADVAPTLAAGIADRMAKSTHDVQHALDAVHSVTDERASHEARIAAKRLRYLIEPAAPHVDEGDDVLRQLKELQDDLGTLHDHHVMARELVRLGEASAAAEARAELVDALGDFGACLEGETTSMAAVTPAPAGSLVALAERLREHIDDAFKRAHARWLEGRHRQLDDAIAAFARRLRAEFGG